MNIPQLINAFHSLSLNGADLSVEVRRENSSDRRVTSVSITGCLVNPIDEITDYGFQFVIDIDRNRQTIDSNVQGTIIDHDEGDTFPGMISFQNGVEAFEEAEAIANTLEALLTPEPPVEPTVKIHWSLDESHILIGIFDSVGHPLPDKWCNFLLDGCSAWSSIPEDDRPVSGTIAFVMSRRDARALRNRAHKAARAFINEFGEGYQEDQFLQRLRDDLDDALDVAA